MALYAPSDAILYAKSMIKSMPIDTGSALTNGVPYKLVDYVASLMWSAAPWKWTIGTLPTVSVVAATTDYSVTPPADFLYLNKAIISDGSTSNELRIVSALPATITQVGVPSQIAYLDASNIVRVGPKPPTSYAQTLTMLYKKTPSKLISSNYGTAGAQIFPDAYFPVFQAGVLWHAYQYADDARAGGATVDGEGKRQYTGQLGIFQSMIAEMRMEEKLTLEYPGVPTTHG